MKLVIASNNAKKRAEIAAILTHPGLEPVPAAETRFVDVVEDGLTFAENARKKAETFAMANGMPALADDSGLCVEALNGAPGVYSSRYAGEHASDEDNYRKLLAEMRSISDRRASFVCALHLAFPDGCPPLTACGRVDGEILAQPCGHQGFGYDPVFFCPELDKPFALATPEEKASVSHRGRALQQLLNILQAYV